MGNVAFCFRNYSQKNNESALLFANKELAKKYESAHDDCKYLSYTSAVAEFGKRFVDYELDMAEVNDSIIKG